MVGMCKSVEGYEGLAMKEECRKERDCGGGKRILSITSIPSTKGRPFLVGDDLVETGV